MCEKAFWKVFVTVGKTVLSVTTKHWEKEKGGRSGEKIS